MTVYVAYGGWHNPRSSDLDGIPALFIGNDLGKCIEYFYTAAWISRNCDLRGRSAASGLFLSSGIRMDDSVGNLRWK